MSTKKRPITAIITRTKNRPVLFERAVKSVLAQTSKDYIHVILNDGGDKEVVEKILAENPDENRKVIHNKESAGLVAALNQAIRAVDSEFIAILDDDDVWHPERLEKSLDTIAAHAACAAVAPMEIVIESIDEQGGIIEEIERKPHPESWSGEVNLFRQAHRNFLSNGAIHYSRDLYDKLGGYDESLPVAEDWDFGIRLLLETDVEQVRSEEALVYYNQRPSIKTGDLGNSVHARVLEQERAINIVRNRFLREELRKGVLGIGYIMNDSEQSLVNVVRLEGHVNRAVDEIRNDINTAKHSLMDTRFYSKVRRLLGGR